MGRSSTEPCEPPFPASNGGAQFFDPANPDNQVAEGLLDYSGEHRARKLDVIIQKANQASALISEARATPTKGRSLDCWAEVFGSELKGIVP